MKYLNFTFLGVAIFCAACLVGSFRENSELRQRLEQNEQTITQMRHDHDLAMAAADEALAARKEINNVQNRKAAQLDALLHACPDLDDLPIPADLRLFLKNACERPDANSPAGRSDLRY